MPARPAKALVLPATRNRVTIPVVSKERFFIYYLLGLLSDGQSICFVLYGFFLGKEACWISCDMELYLGASLVQSSIYYIL